MFITFSSQQTKKSACSGPGPGKFKKESIWAQTGRGPFKELLSLRTECNAAAGADSNLGTPKQRLQNVRPRQGRRRVRRASLLQVRHGPRPKRPRFLLHPQLHLPLPPWPRPPLPSRSQRHRNFLPLLLDPFPTHPLLGSSRNRAKKSFMFDLVRLAGSFHLWKNTSRKSSRESCSKGLTSSLRLAVGL